MGWRDWIRDVEIEPSLYAADFLRLGEQIETLLGAGARLFHVDVGDGRFIPPVTIGPVVVQAVAPVVHRAGGRLDCHLMVVAPDSHFEQIKQAGGDSVTFHLEVCPDPEAAVAAARACGLGVGIAINPDTPIDVAAAAAGGVDLVLCMSVHPGYSGQAFVPGSLERVRGLRELLGAGQLIQVDGGVTADNVRAVREAGADLIVAGSAIFSHGDVAGTYGGLARAVA
ncbi:MAG: ribulose-phosphate 3-epimerase [Thermoleophilia bacterium]|nr:ribulose-phosphate 3-epimerase [Thermoleophilia bacterium]